MGVPGFFLWLMKNYKKEGFVFNKSKLLVTDINLLKKNRCKFQTFKKIKILYIQDNPLYTLKIEL